jgi:HlyD family secretion protein
MKTPLGPLGTQLNTRLKQFKAQFKSLLQTHAWFRRGFYLVLVILAFWIIWKVLSAIFGWSDPEYKTAQIVEGPLAVTISASGTLNPVKSVQVGTQVSGMVQEIDVDFNDVVKKGQVIARIDPREWQARFEQAEANYILAKRNHDNNIKLIEKKFISPAAFDQTLSAYKSAKASLSMAKKALDDTVIRSPVDGVVVKRSVERGQTVAASLQAPELFIIAQNLADMQVETAIDESDVGRIVEGMTATFTVDAFPGKVFQSQVKQVRKAPINVQNVITYTVLLTAQNNDLKLLPGMTANTSIITEQKEKVLRIPNAALRFKMPNTQPSANNQFTKNDAANPSRGSSGSSSSGNSGGAGSSNSSSIATALAPMTGKPSAIKDGKVSVRKVWVLEKSGLKEKPVQKTIRVGLSDGNVTEILPGERDAESLKPGDRVIVGVVGGAGKASATRPTGPRLF